MKYTIRKGVKADLPQVLNLIRELAVYERAPLEVTVTVEEMEQDGFGDNPIFKFFVAESENEIIGISLYYIKYSTWKGKCIFLEDIIVTEQLRKHGIGKKLFDEVVKIAKETKVKRLEWQCEIGIYDRAQYISEIQSVVGFSLLIIALLQLISYEIGYLDWFRYIYILCFTDTCH